MIRRYTSYAIAAAAAMIAMPPAVHAALVASYQFQNDLVADDVSNPDLIAVDPLGNNGFEGATVFGQSRTVYRFDGDTGNNAGLTLDTTGLIPADNYSVVMIFEFDSSSNYRRIVDVEDRQSDNGFYVDPSSNLSVYPEAAGATTFTASDYHHVVLTNAASSDEVNAYLDGNLEFTFSPDAVMDIANAGNLMHFFLDNVAGSFTDEVSDGRIALLRLYDSALTDADVAALYNGGDPWAVVPEIGGWALAAAAAIVGGLTWAGRNLWSAMRKNGMLYFLGHSHCLASPSRASSLLCLTGIRPPKWGKT